MLSTPLICCSIGAATDCSIVNESAPVKCVCTWISGGAICGYCAIGNARMQTPPINVIRIAMTMATIGRLTKNSDIGLMFSGSGRSDFLGRGRPILYRYRDARANFLNALDNDSVAWL